MGLYGTSVVERLLLKLLVPVCVLSGAAVAGIFFFPEVVGDVVPGRLLLVVVLLFFGSGLTYLALLPTEHVPEDEFDAAVLLRVRRAGVLDTLSGALSRQDPVVFGVPVAVFAAYFLGQLIAPTWTVETISWLQTAVTTNVGWLFVAAMVLSVLFCLYLLVGPWGAIKLGGPDVEPTYSYPVYFTMFFTAGIAAGIVYNGPTEALAHYATPPPFFDADPHSEAAITAAMVYTLFHWGFSAWSAYLVIGVPIAYFVYRHGAPLRVSTLLTPFLGLENLGSRWCRLVDTLAVFATIGGIATSVAFVSGQFLSGVSFQWGVSVGTVGALVFVAGLTVVFVASAQSGVDRGIRRLAALNVVLFALFAALLLAVAPRGFVLSRSAEAVGHYALAVVPLSLYVGDEWAAAWTVWNWAWWFSWAPFAGLFLAALSRGRRIRTVVFTGVVATSLATMAWFLLVSSTTLHLQHAGVVDVLAAVEAHDGSDAVAGFPVFETLPISELFMFLFLALIVVFMATSADTSTLVVAVLTTKRERAPTTGAIVFWGVFQGVVALSALATGTASAQALQAMTVLVGGPFAILAVVSLLGMGSWCRRHEGGVSLIGVLRGRFDGRNETTTSNEDEADE